MSAHDWHPLTWQFTPDGVNGRLGDQPLEQGALLELLAEDGPVWARWNPSASRGQVEIRWRGLGSAVAVNVILPASGGVARQAAPPPAQPTLKGLDEFGALVYSYDEGEPSSSSSSSEPAAAEIREN